MGVWVTIYRSESGDLHREGLPAIAMASLKQWWWNGKLHNSRGPAVVTPNCEMYFWRGIHVEKSMWDSMHGLSATEILAIPNLELRRVVIERVGPSRLILEAKLLDEELADSMPRQNRLYEVAVADDESVVFVELCNSTREDDGSHKTYFLRVPPDTKKVRDAIAWSLDIDVEQGYSFIYES